MENSGACFNGNNFSPMSFFAFHPFFSLFAPNLCTKKRQHIFLDGGKAREGGDE